MLRTSPKSFLRPIALFALLGLAACQAADGTTQAPDTALVKSIMGGLGAIDPKEKPIDYKPRAPLVMPAQATALPEPETRVAGSGDQNWPQAGKSADLEAVTALYGKDRSSGVNDNAGTRLTPDQMRGINIYSNKQRNLEAEVRQGEIDEGARLTRGEMRQQSDKATDLREQVAGQTEGALAVRRYLTEPPTAYSTPSADAPMPRIAIDDKSTGLAPGEVSCETNPHDINCKYPERR